MLAVLITITNPKGVLTAVVAVIGLLIIALVLGVSERRADLRRQTAPPVPVSRPPATDHRPPPRRPVSGPHSTRSEDL